MKRRSGETRGGEVVQAGRDPFDDRFDVLSARMG